MQKTTCQFILLTSDYKCYLASVLICFDQSCIVHRYWQRAEASSS